MITFPMKCRSCGREFECDGHCANLGDLDDMEEWCKLPDSEKEKEQKERSEWKVPEVKVCTCDYCRNRLVDSHGKLLDNHCEPIEVKVQFT